MKKLFSYIFVAFITLSFLTLGISCNSCQSKKNTTETVIETYTKIAPDFNADSAYAYVEKQVNFGPRVPSTPEHIACGDYLSRKLKEFGANVTEQKTTVKHYNGKNLPIRNIIGSYLPENPNRVLLYAHWDSRPFADHDTDISKQNQPILGADDGASGVGVLLEVARQLKAKQPNIGIDIIFFDLEDWGQADFDKNIVEGDWWCVGSQYWAKNPHTPNYKARFGILLDMVGAGDATFLKEGYSAEYASNVVEKVWTMAAKLGYSTAFVNQTGGYVMDDHVPVIQNNRAPSADIINTKQNINTGFAPHWHTHKDNMDIINKDMLKKVGETILEVIYNEK